MTEALLYEVSMDLGSGTEAVQSAVSYLFIFLCGGATPMSPRIQRQLQSGTISMLTTVQSLPVLTNGLGQLGFLLFEKLNSLIQTDLYGQ